MQTKQEWIDYFNQQYGVSFWHERKIEGKKYKFTQFYVAASEELKKDRDLQAMNFERYGNLPEIPVEMIDFDFIQRVFNYKESFKIAQLPYEWKNNSEEKAFLKNILEIISVRQTDYRSQEIMWTFEPGFWSNLEYTKKIKRYDYDYLNLAMIKEFNQSNNSQENQYLIEIVNQNPYYLKYIKSKYKSILSEKTILTYAKDYGIGSLTKEQKNRYEVVKEAFHNHKIQYANLDDKWKTNEILKDLLNNKYIWKHYSNNKDLINIYDLSKELLEDREIIKSCLSDGSNLLELKNNTFTASKWFYDKELKEIALQSYADYKIIEDCLDDKHLVLIFLQNINKTGNNNYSGINLFEQTKRISEEVFDDREILNTYLKIKTLDEKSYFVAGAIKSLQKKNTEELIELININKEVYKVLTEEMKSKWELILPFYKINQGVSNEMPKDIFQTMLGFKGTQEEKEQLVSKFALEEKLLRTLGEREKVKKLKI